MKDHAYRPFFLTLFVVVLLTIAHWLPTLHLGDTQLRRIDLLSDLGNSFLLQGSGGVIARGGARKRATDLAVVEGRVHGRQEVA